MLVILDDDPTGAQAVAGVPVALDWDRDVLLQASVGDPRAVHVLTNSRAYTPARAKAVIEEAVQACLGSFESPQFLLRGDSTLRAHLFEEYVALRNTVFPDHQPPLLLALALPDAGRVTVGGVQFLERDGRRTPLQETEYAADPAFAYGNARLRVWAEDRSQGYFRATDAIEVPLTALRGDGAQCVCDALQKLSESGVPSVCVVDAETNADLQTAAAGLSLARAKEIPVVVRSAPAFAGIFAGTLAKTQQPPPRADRGLLVVCGSWVPTTTAQLRLLVRAHPNSLVEVDAAALASLAPDSEIRRAADVAQASLRTNGIAIVATPREFSPVAAGERIARNLASIVAQIQPLPSVVLAKGGITSAVTARHGLGVRLAQVVGPIAAGVSLWHARAANGETVPYIVFPGNVGDEESLVRVVDRILAA